MFQNFGLNIPHSCNFTKLRLFVLFLPLSWLRNLQSPTCFVLPIEDLISIISIHRSNLLMVLHKREKHYASTLKDYICFNKDLRFILNTIIILNIK